MKSLFLLGFLFFSASFAEAAKQNIAKRPSMDNRRCVPNMQNGKPAGMKCFKISLNPSALKRERALSVANGLPVDGGKKAAVISRKSTAPIAPAARPGR